MAFPSRKSPKKRGGVLLTTLFFITAMTMIMAPVVNISLQTYKLTMRNRLRAEARAVAESELDYLFYQFMALIVAGNDASEVPSAIATLGLADSVATNASNPVPTTERTAFLKLHSDAGWRVKRSMQFIHSESGRIPETTKIGRFAYVTARVEVFPSADSSLADQVVIRIGRRFVNSSTSIFQYGVFFEGNLELNPGGGGNTIVDGDVVANGSIFMAPRIGSTLTLKGKIRSEHFNTLADDTTPALYNPDAPGADAIQDLLTDPTFFYTKDQQVEKLKSRENLLGGIDPSATASNRPDLFGPEGRLNPDDWTQLERIEAENKVFSSLIAPPPAEAAAAEYPNATTSATDDAVISARRAYNRAGLIVTVEGGATTITKVVDGVRSDVTADYADIISPVSDLYDNRESKAVKLTTIDIEMLKTRLPSDSSFNGLIYINLKDITSASPAAIRLVNAENLPTDTDGNKGFSVATNGGIYVQGSYNTTTFTESDGSTRNVPAMLIGDSLTVLSDGFVPSATSTPISSRVATLSPEEIARGGEVQINAGLLTGNVPSSITAGTVTGSSGGVQNLVRYLEDWRTDGVSEKNVVFKGSLGRLFSSKWFTASFSTTSSGQVYQVPTTREFKFDKMLQSKSPPGTPTSTDFSLGVYFTW